MLGPNEVYILPQSERLARLRRLSDGKEVVVEQHPYLKLGFYFTLLVLALWMLASTTASGEQKGVSALRPDTQCNITVSSLTGLEQSIVTEALMQAAFVIREDSMAILSDEERTKAARTIRQAAAIFGLQLEP